MNEAVRIRPWELADKPALVRYANNYNVWRNLRDRFPHPYTESDADVWLALCAARAHRPMNFAIDLNGEAVGGTGFELLRDVHRITAEMGFWVAEPFWGKGIATAAARLVTEYAFATFPLERLQATVFEWNTASARVLEKAGYRLDGRLRRAIVKEGRVADTLIYGRLRQET